MQAIPRLVAGALASLALVCAPAAALPSQSPTVTATLSQPIYELGDTVELTITGEPGAWVCILVDTQLGSFTLPGLITFDLAYTPSFAVTDLGPLPPTGKLVLSLPTDCSDMGLTEGPIFVQVAMFPSVNPLPATMSNVATLLVANGDCDACPAAATQDATVSSLPGGMALFLPGLGGDFVFDGQASIEERKDGTASLRGVIVSTANASDRFILQADLTGRLDSTDAAFPPAGSPNKKLLPSAFTENGGPVDTTNWHYYTDLTGNLIGLDNLAGALVELDDFGAAPQLGRGANGKNLDYGLCAGLETSVTVQPSNGSPLAGTQSGELTLQVGTCPPPADETCADESLPGGHVMWWPEVSKHFMPLGKPLNFEEYADGTARLWGTIAVDGDAGKCFELDVHFSDRLDFGDAAFPPVGSPKWGNVDPATADENTFHYYEKSDGVLIGCGEFAGATITLDRKGPAFQVGVGANYHDLDEGGCGWFYMTVITQPVSGMTFTTSTSGDINLDFTSCPTTSLAPLAHWDFSEQTGTHAVDSVGGIDLAFHGSDFAWTSDATGLGLAFTDDDGDMLKTDSKSDGKSLREALQATNAVTLQIQYSQDDDCDNDSRLFSWSSSTSVSDRNLTMMSEPAGSSFEGQLRLTTTSGTTTFTQNLGMAEHQVVVYTMTYDAAEGILRAYLDGTLIASTPHSGDFSNWKDHKLRFGNEAGGKRSFQGVIYDIKMWSRALDASEVAAEASAL